MLERPALLLRPWMVAPRQPSDRDRHRSAGAWTRSILDAATGESLGLARWQSGDRWIWLPWLAQPQLAVYEGEDESLVFTLHRPRLLSPEWQVQDADEHRVGTVRGTVLRDQLDRLFAVIAPSADRSVHRFLAADGAELGSLNRSPEGLRVAFAEELADNPFAKMVLLAAALRAET
jgi:hypothetical protein